MHEVRFSICPEDCWVCQVSERFPEVTGEVLSFKQVAGLGRWKSHNRKDLTNAFAFAKRHKHVSALEQIHPGDNCLVTSAIPNDNQFPQFIEEMEDRVGEVDLTCKSTASEIDPDASTASGRALSRLTPRQKEALQLAYRNEYYDHPRKTTIQNMASEMAIGKSTFQTHLRKAEKRILEAIMENAH